MQNISFTNVLQGGIYVFITVTWQNRSCYLVYKYISSLKKILKLMKADGMDLTPNGTLSGNITSGKKRKMN
jgi:hypothetical protein